MKENQITFADDQLKLKPFAENLLQMMEKGTASAITDIGYRGGYTVSLNAEFGNGKTTFLKMFENFIKTEQRDNYDVLFVNAWESDFAGDPVVSILSEFINWLQKKDKNNKKLTGTKKEAIGKAIVTVTGIMGNMASQVIQNKTGIDILKAVTNQEIQNIISKAKDSGRGNKWLWRCLTRTGSRNINTVKNSLGNIILENFNLRKNAIQEVKNALSEYLSTEPQPTSEDGTTKEVKRKRKLLVIVDELDRTRPDYAVRFMEDMKHFFDIENVIFLVAVNRTQMEATVKCLYGQDLSFDGYYGKFFKQEIDLPDPYKEAHRLIDNLIKKTKIKYDTDNRKSRMDLTYLSCKTFKLTLREVEQFIRIFKMIVKHDQKSVSWIYLDCYPFFICLSMKHKEVFNKIPNGDLTLTQFIDFLNEAYPELKTLVSKDIELNYLLAEVACSFLVNSQKTHHYTPSEDEIKHLQTVAPLIDMKRLKEMINHFCNRETFGRMLEQPVLNICKNIQQCKSHFSN